jgi:hypothetical protein
MHPVLNYLLYYDKKVTSVQLSYYYYSTLKLPPPHELKSDDLSSTDIKG